MNNNVKDAYFQVNENLSIYLYKIEGRMTRSISIYITLNYSLIMENSNNRLQSLGSPQF